MGGWGWGWGGGGGEGGDEDVGYEVLRSLGGVWHGVEGLIPGESTCFVDRAFSPLRSRL